MSARSTTERGRRVLYGLVVPVICVAMLGCAVWVSLTARDQLADLDPEVLPVSGPVTSGSVDYSAPASLRITSIAADPLLGSGQAGTVTAVHIADGDTIDTGQRLYEVDGIEVTAYQGEAVFYRALSEGDWGDDVEALQTLLTQLLPEVSLTSDGHYGASTAEAVRAFERRIGIGEPAGVFAPTWFVRIPHAPYPIETTSLLLGGPAPASGEEIATATSRVDQANLTVPNFAGPDGSYEFATGGQTAAVSREQDEWLIEPGDAGQLLTATLSVEEPTVLEGRIRLLEGEPAQLIPGSALMTDEAGETCVRLVSADGTSSDTVAVTVLGIEVAGPVQIAPALPQGSEVVINPYEATPGATTCPSS